MSKGQDGSGQGVYLQAFSGTGAKVNIEFRANTTTAGNQTEPVFVALSAGQFLVAWTAASDGSGTGISFQRFVVPVTQ